MTDEPPRLSELVARAETEPERGQPAPTPLTKAAPRADPAGRPEATSREDSDRERERRVLSLHDRRGQDLYGFAIGLGLRDEEAADAVQETMLRLWRELASGNDVHDVDAWAFRTAYHLAIDQHRLQTRLAGSLGRLVARGGKPAVDPADSADSAALWQAVDSLPERQRAVLYLRYRADLPFERVGFVLGITSSAARSHATNALATLRRRLGQEES
jgi:RNA polymerase sigma-70 factor (ECF subfamily)